MIQTDILCIGNLKEQYWRDACREYTKRMAPYCKIDIRELKESRLPMNASLAEEEAAILAEGEAMGNAIGTNSYVIALDIQGKAMDSIAFSDLIGNVAGRGTSKIVFLIGGSLGMSEKILEKADLRLSFSNMTFPHQLMRVVLLEQLYRAFKILRNEPYHK